MIAYANAVDGMWGEQPEGEDEERES
jgi:hypothetical protein